MDNNEHMFEDETEQNTAGNSGNPYGNPYGNAGQNNGNLYGGSNQNNQYSYNSNPYTNGQSGPQVGPNGKKLSVGFGVASLVLGIKIGRAHV